MDSSAPTILTHLVRVPNTLSTLLSFIFKFVLYLSCEKNENQQKEAVVGPVKSVYEGGEKKFSSVEIVVNPSASDTQFTIIFLFLSHTFTSFCFVPTYHYFVLPTYYHFLLPM